MRRLGLVNRFWLYLLFVRVDKALVSIIAGVFCSSWVDALACLDAKALVRTRMDERRNILWINM